MRSIAVLSSVEHVLVNWLGVTMGKLAVSAATSASTAAITTHLGTNGLHVPANARLAYQEAISALNSLQSNAAVLEKARKARSRHAWKSFDNAYHFLVRMGILVEDLTKLNIIHVAGTKGKGSTCAFAESILRAEGLKTGFYSSPHLVAARERIRINGEPLSPEAFSSYFWDVYLKLEQQKGEDDLHMPPYFMFLTVMAFHVFLQEKVDVAVMEVGMGGQYDSTNVVQSPTVVGISSLGMDHMAVLGNTIEEIAWQKAGIFKRDVPAFTVPQPEAALSVLRKRAREIQCPLYLVPPFDLHKWEKMPAYLGVPGEVQKCNAALALHLVRMWQQRTQGSVIISNPRECMNDSSLDGERLSRSVACVETFVVPETYTQGLEKCRWPGRFQILKRGNITYYLDGAHTAESISLCAKWFAEAADEEQAVIGIPMKRCLLFNCTGERKADTLLAPLVECLFDVAAFSPNKVAVTKPSASDLSNFTVDPQRELQQCQTNKQVWEQLSEGASVHKATTSSSHGSSSASVPAVCNHNNSRGFCPPCHIFDCIAHALLWISTSQDLESHTVANMAETSMPDTKAQPGHIQVLVTGSLHLVGGVLAMLDPDLKSQCPQLNS